MSKKGQILRGEKWYLLNRDANGNLKKVILDDKNKMVDVNLYLEEVKKEEKKPEVKKGVK